MKDGISCQDLQNCIWTRLHAMKNMSSSEGTQQRKELGVKPFLGTNLGEKQYFGPLFIFLCAVLIMTFDFISSLAATLALGCAPSWINSNMVKFSFVSGYGFANFHNQSDYRYKPWLGICGF
jgi:hypothetical protein